MASVRDLPPHPRATPTSAPAFGDAVAGCLLGGAVGDALGAVVEFDSLADIRRRYGPAGLTGFPEDAGPFTDDTQMTLFTAEALLRARRRYAARHFAYAVDELWTAYRRWLATQGEGSGRDDQEIEGLASEPRLHHRRGPGNTCLSALRGDVPGYVDKPVNGSKGCGGVMRIAPIGLVAARPFGLGIASAALTHGHPSGYLSAGAGAEIIARLRGGEALRPAVESALDVVSSWQGHEETTEALLVALDLADRTPAPTPDAIAEIGEGWVGEEALAIAVFCALTGDSFQTAVLAAANHSGDSDSTAAITGNLLGAAGGRAVVPEDWLAALTERDLVERVADELTAAFAASRSA